MRNKSILISEGHLMFVIAGQLFDQAPNRQPRKPEIIMQKVRDAFRALCYNDNEWYAAEVPEADGTFTSYKFIEDLLMGIPEFTELNLSQTEFEKGILVDDESRPKYGFTSRYDVETGESWKNDFIDLDAFINNVHARLLWLVKSDQDCFACVNSNQGHVGLNLMGISDVCRVCLVNPNLTYNYEGERKPKGEYTFACKYNCREHKYICCEECPKKDACVGKCDGESETCGNIVDQSPNESSEPVSDKKSVVIKDYGKVRCPICDAYICGIGQIKHRKVNHCPNCGQALDCEQLIKET